MVKKQGTNAGGDTAPHAPSAVALRRATGRLSTAATTRMEADLPWFADLRAEERSWVGQIVQAGIRSFVDWYATPDSSHKSAIAAEVFGSAPRALTGVISLRQTVDLIRLSIEVVESHVDEIVRPEDSADVHAHILRYGREVAFATAEVYARAAEMRGAWDARLEALVVDAALRADADDAALSRAGALGWTERGSVCVVLGTAAPQRPAGDLFEDVRRSARTAGMDALCGLQGDRLVVVLGGASGDTTAAQTILDHFGPGPVVAGPLVSDLHEARRSAQEALAAHGAAAGWPAVPRPVAARELATERALAGDPLARQFLIEQVYAPLATTATLADTLTAYFSAGQNLEGAARALFVHPNTVRYRLRQASSATGLLATDPHDALTLQLALVLGRQEAASGSDDL